MRRLILLVVLVSFSVPALGLGYNDPSKISGGGFANSAAPVALIAAPPTGRIYLDQVTCSSVDGVNIANTVTFNDAANTSFPLAGGDNVATAKAFSPPLQGPVGGTLTFKISQPAVVKCTARGHLGP